jgi:VPDSG-CTERM motif
MNGIENILNCRFSKDCYAPGIRIPSADFTQRKVPISPGNTKQSLPASKRVGKTYGLPSQLPQSPAQKSLALPMLERKTDDCKIQGVKKESKSMKRKWLIMVAAAAAVCGVASVAQAVPTSISGNITFVGGVELNTSSAATASEVLAWTGFGGSGSPFVESADGSFSGIAPGTSATFSSPWFFNSGAVSGLWSVGGFTFDLTSSHVVYQATTVEGGVAIGAATVEGIGAIMGNGESPEAMTWSFSINDPGAAGGNGLIFSFQVADGTIGSTPPPEVPDGGTTAMMLGLGVLGLGLIKKQMLA